MGIVAPSKLNRLLTNWPSGAVHTTTWLLAQGLTDQDLQKYRVGKWIERIGVGAYKKSGDEIDWSGGLSALQRELNLPIHIGGRSALSEIGQAQYLTLGENTLLLMGPKPDALPAWFTRKTWTAQLKYKRKNIFNDIQNTFGSKTSGFTTRQKGPNTYVVSARERALFECLDEMPNGYSYDEALELFEAMPDLRSGVVQNLLETCTSMKVKRLFLHFADRFQHPWFRKLKLGKIDLGRGNRVVFKDGMLDPKYLVTVPRIEDESRTV